MAISTTSKPHQLSRATLNRLEYETPYFLLDLAQVEHNYKMLSAALRKAQLFYAVKANSEPTLLRRLADLGSNFEVASFNELQILLRLGVTVDRVIYSNPVKPPLHIKRAFEKGLHRFAFDSSYELEKIAANAPGASVYLRFVVNDKDSTFPLSKKFGAEPQDALALMQYARTLGLVPYGLTFHVGSQSLNPRTWESAIIAAGNVMREMEQHDIRIDMLDLGGGFPANYGFETPSMTAIGMVINRAVKQYLPYKVALFAEPGRALAADTCALVASVIGKAERGSKTWLYLDVGAFNGMMETLETGNRFHYPIETSTSSNKHEDPGELGLFTLTGPTCDTQDTMFYDLQLPKNISIGDCIYIFSAGAYTSTYASSFNGFGPPKTYYLQQ